MPNLDAGDTLGAGLRASTVSGAVPAAAGNSVSYLEENEVSGFIREFQKFAMRGNVLDMAVGIIIGAAFGKIVNSLVENILMPPIGFFVGGNEFAQLALALGPGKDGEPVVLKYGLFVQSVVDFVIIALAIFLLVKGINRAREAFEDRREREEQAQGPPQPPEDIVLLREIRDALQGRQGLAPE